MAQKTLPSWSTVKPYLADFDRAGLIGLIQDLYQANKENQAFLHARFALGADVLNPYKTTIDRWLWPDVFKNQNTSVAKAKKAIADYKKAVGAPQGMAELCVFYCERAAGFCDDIAYVDDGYFDALVRMFEQALKSISALPDSEQPALLARLNQVQNISYKFGYGVGEAMESLIKDYI